MTLDLCRISRHHVISEQLDADPDWNVTLHMDGVVSRTIANWYDSAPLTSGTKSEKIQYALLKANTLQQFELLRRNGITIEPWLSEGQPYTTSASLGKELYASHKLYVFLTANGHGESAHSQAAQRPSDHPMLEPSPVMSRGQRLLFNDLFRAVHDAFGHAARGNNFTARGEFMATWDHMKMYRPECHPVLVSETVGQICWFYFGPHLRRPDGTLPRPTEPDYVPPSKRPYSPQKTVPMPDELLSAFRSLFKQVNR